MLKLNNPQS